MKTILVPAGGGGKEQVAFETALALARTLSAHIDFYHVRVSPGEAAMHTPHVGLCLRARRCARPWLIFRPVHKRALTQPAAKSKVFASATASR